MIVNKIEKRELIEQRRKVFEAGTQRVDKRTGSPSFLTWAFFIAPLIAGRDFLDLGRQAAAAEEHATAAHKSSAVHPANDDTAVTDFSQTSGDKQPANGGSPTQHPPHVHPIGLAPQSHEDLQPGSAHNEAVATASSRGDGSGPGNDPDWGNLPSVQDSSVYSLSADSHVGSSQMPGETVLESVPSSILASSFNPSVAGSPHLLGSLTSDATGTIASVEVTVQPAIATLADAVSSMGHVGTSTLAPLDATTQPVLASLSDTADTLTKDVTHVAPIDTATTQPVLTALLDSADATKDVTHLASIEATTQPVLASLSDTADSLTKDVTHLAPLEATTQPVLASLSDTADSLTKDVTHLAPLEATTQPVLASLSDTADTTKDVTSAAAVDPTGPVIAMGDSANALTQDVTHSTSDIGGSEPFATMVTAQVDSSSDVSHQADTLLALATAPEAPIQVAQTTTGTTAPVLRTDIAGDVIALNDAPPPENTLFSGTQYTQYGITLSSGATSSQQAVSPADATSDQHTSAPTIADVQPHTPAPADIVDPTHSTDHLAHAIL
jgi:hypothetical protein